MLRRTVLALLAVPVLAGVGLILAVAQDWQEYRPDGFGYRIELPGAPEITTDERQGKSGTTKITSAEVTFEHLGFVVNHSEYPVPMSQDWYNDLRAAFKDIGMKILRDEAIVVTGLPGREFVLELHDVLYIRRFVIAGKRMIEIGVSSDGKDVLRDRDMESHPVVERSLRSFALLPPLVR